MRLASAVVLLALAAGSLATLATPASAHPLGNFSVNRYSRIEIGRERVTLRYVLDLAEIPTLQELQAAGIDGMPEPAQRESLLRRLAPALRDGAHLTLGGSRVRWDERDASLEFLPGQAGLSTLRLSLWLVAPVPATDGSALEYRDTSFADRVGWREVVLRPAEGIRLDAATVPGQDESDELRRYPTDPKRAPLAVTSATATIRISAESAAGGVARPASGSSRSGVDAIPDRIGELIRAGAEGDVSATLLALIFAAGLGAAHALTPGHGKTVMAAYLVGTHGTARQAVTLGGVVAITHTAGVLALALIVLAASAVVTGERLYPYLSALSALVVLGIGAWLAAGVVRRHAHDRAHRHGHEHDHGHGHDVAGAVGWRALAVLGISGGAVPSASALLLLLASIALRRPDLGVLLLVAFGIGMAGVLVGLGLSLVGAARATARRLDIASPVRRLGPLVPAVTAAIVLIVGFTLTLQAGQGVLTTLP